MSSLVRPTGDYLPSMLGVGIRSAHAAVRTSDSLERAVHTLCLTARNPPRGEELKQYIAQVNSLCRPPHLAPP